MESRFYHNIKSRIYQRIITEKKKEEEEVGLRKPQSESSHSNKPAYRFNHEHFKIKLNKIN